MRLVRSASSVLAVALCAATAVAAHGRSPSRLFTVVNAATASIVSLRVADAGSGVWADVPMGEPLQGGLTSATFRLPQGACLRRVLVTFRDGRSSAVEGVDTCRFHRMRIER